MTFLPLYVLIGLTILALMAGLWVLSLSLHNSSIVDIFWGAGFVVVAWLTFALAPQGFLPRKLLLATLVTLWGLRLSIHILIRNWRKAEDFRYRGWREQAGPSWWWRSFFKVFLLQGLLMWIIAAPIVAAQLTSVPKVLTQLDGLAIPVWSIGFVFEAAGDWQLARFRADPSNRGKLLITGVWRFTRHPNYFGDAAQWWAFFLLAASTPGGLWTIFSPLIMTGLLVRISGVALLEETLKQTKPGYAEYVHTTSPFLPWFPRRPR
jgi:steroid 5-alpha reductase family enzyme